MLAGHVLRQPEVRPANVAMNWIPEDGKGSRERPQNTWSIWIIWWPTSANVRPEIRHTTPTRHRHHTTFPHVVLCHTTRKVVWCVLWCGHVYISRQFNLTLLSWYQTAVEQYSVTDRLTPSATDRLLVMYSILPRHVFFTVATSSSCLWLVVEFVIWPLSASYYINLYSPKSR